MEELIINANVQGDEGVKKLTTDIDKLGTEITDTAKAFDKLDKATEQSANSTKKETSEIAKLRKEIKDAKSDMLKYAEGTNEYNRALKRASDAQFKLKDSNDKARAAVQDFGQTGRNVAQSVAGLAGGFSVVTGAMALFGVENDATAKALLKVQAAVSIATGIGQFADSIDNVKDLIAGFRASAEASKGVITELSMVNKEASGSMNTLAKETAVVGSNLAGVGVIGEKFTDATNAMSSANTKFIESISKNTELERLRTNYSTLTVDLNKYKEGSEEYIDILAKMEDVENEMTDIVKEKSDIISEQLKVTDELNKTTEKSTQVTDKATKSVGKQLLVMGAWIALIAAAIIAIGYLIDWVNKIPEDVQINIDVNSDAIKKTQATRESIMKFQSDVTKAQDTHNKKQLSYLEEYAKKEFGLVIDLHKVKAADLKKWGEEYLKTMTDIYFNESIIKKTAEAKVGGETSLNKAQTLYKSQQKNGIDKRFVWNDLVRMANDGSIKESVFESLYVYGLNQQIIDELRNVNLQNQLLKNMPKLKNVSSFFNKPSGGSTKSTDTKEKQQKISKIPIPYPEKVSIEKAFGEVEAVYQENYYTELADLEFQHNNLLLSDVAFYKQKKALREKYGMVANLTDVDLFNAEQAALDNQYNNMLISYEDYLKKTRELQIKNGAETNKTDEELIQERVRKFQEMSSAISDLYSGIADLAQGSMDLTNQEYDAKIWANDEVIQSDQEREANAYAIEMARYEALKKDFEMQKKAKEAQAWMDFASGSVGIWTAPGITSLAPYGYILAGIQQAALLASTIGNVKTIRSQTLDKPHAAKGSSAAASAVSVTPNKTALTSSQENLNMMNQAGQSKISNVVKVSDIDKAQNKVSVRDNNSKL